MLFIAIAFIRNITFKIGTCTFPINLIRLANFSENVKKKCFFSAKIRDYFRKTVQNQDLRLNILPVSALRAFKQEDHTMAP